MFKSKKVRQLLIAYFVVILLFALLYYLISLSTNGLAISINDETMVSQIFLELKESVGNSDTAHRSSNYKLLNIINDYNNETHVASYMDYSFVSKYDFSGTQFPILPDFSKDYDYQDSPGFIELRQVFYYGSNEFADQKIPMEWADYYYHYYKDKSYNSFSINSVTDAIYVEYDKVNSKSYILEVELYQVTNEYYSDSSVFNDYHVPGYSWKTFDVVSTETIQLLIEERDLLQLMEFEEGVRKGLHDICNSLVLNSKPFQLIFGDNEQETNVDFIMNFDNFLPLLMQSSSYPDDLPYKLQEIMNDKKVGTFCDYFYFSVVSITTLGFGDMVPNTTAIRFLVVIEAILGLLIMGGIITHAFESKTKFAIQN